MSETAIFKWSWLSINKKYLRILQVLEFKMIGMYDTVPIVALELQAVIIHFNSLIFILELPYVAIENSVSILSLVQQLWIPKYLETYTSLERSDSSSA